jgi:hypothetical protein
MCSRRFVALMILGCLGMATGVYAEAVPTTAKADKVELKDVTYKGLGEVIKAHRGKVIVVDIWDRY